MRHLRWVLWFAGVALAMTLGAALGCDPSVSSPVVSVARSPPDGLSITTEPEGPLDGAPRVLRLHVTSSGAPLDPSSFMLVRGNPSAADLRKLASDAPGATLAARLVPTLRWRETSTGEIVIAPEVPLEAAQMYTLAGGDPVLREAFTVASEDTVRILPRLWPPDQTGAAVDVGVWCDSALLPDGREPASLAPKGPSGAIARGVFESLGDRCLRFEAEDAGAPDASLADGSVFVPPPVAHLGGATLRLDPRVFTLGTSDDGGAAATPLSCDGGQAIGPGCATVEDDRILVHPPSVSLLWAIAGADVDLVRASEPGVPFLITGLSPGAAVTLDVGVIDAAGRRERTTVTATTKASMPHVILSEVFANPLGTEPAEEWVELYNDGTAVAELEGYVLSDPGGTTLLPEATLPPGAYALVVNQDFAADDGFDPVPKAGTILVRVPKLGHGGLSNEGEPLLLEDGSGAVVSKFPPTPKPKAGVSVVRVDPRAPDDVPASFALSADHASPGALNNP